MTAKNIQNARKHLHSREKRLIMKNGILDRWLRLSGGEKPSADRLAETKVQGCQNRNFPGFSRPAEWPDRETGGMRVHEDYGTDD